MNSAYKFRLIEISRQSILWSDALPNKLRTHRSIADKPFPIVDSLDNSTRRTQRHSVRAFYILCPLSKEESAERERSESAFEEGLENINPVQCSHHDVLIGRHRQPLQTRLEHEYSGVVQ